MPENYSELIVPYYGCLNVDIIWLTFFVWGFFFSPIQVFCHVKRSEGFLYF